MKRLLFIFLMCVGVESHAGVIIRGRGIRPLWTPSNMVVRLWLDASDTNTITAAAGYVSQWDDKSGNDIHATQGTGARQPLTGSRSISGKNVLDFDGSSDWMNFAAFDCRGKYVFAMLETDTLGGGDQQILSHSTLNVQLRIMQANGFLGYASDAPFYPNDTSNTTAVVTSTPSVLGYVLNTNIEFSVNGGYEDTGTGNDGSGRTIFNTIGARQQGVTDFLNGKMAELLVTEYLPPTNIRQRIEGYLAWKWGAEGDLSAGHPYKTAAPLCVYDTYVALTSVYSVALIGGSTWATVPISAGNYSGNRYRSAIDFDITSIPDDATINEVAVKIYLDEVGGSITVDMASMTNTALAHTNANDKVGFDADVDSNDYLESSVLFGESTGSYSVRLLASAVTNLQNNLGSNWFSVGWTATTESGDNYKDGRSYSEANPPELLVRYTR